MEGGGGERARAVHARILSSWRSNGGHSVRTELNRDEKPGTSLHLSMFRYFKHAKRLDDLEETVEKLEKSLKNLEIEWSETYDKFRLLNMRVAKRVERLDKDSSQEEPQGAEGEETSTPLGTPMFSTLSARARKIQEQILARRRGQTGGE